MAIDSRIPVTIITGFLGAGKTTLLNHLIRQHPEKKFAVIENEFGEVNIDSQLIVSSDNNNIYELSNGCICCALNEDLANLLYELLESGKTFNHLIIETTGMADPGAVALNFISDFGIQQKYRLDGIIALADAVNLEKELVETEEAAKQLAVADLIVLNKISSVNTETLETVKEKIKTINLAARILTCDQAEVEENILNLKAFSANFVLATNFENYEPEPIMKAGLQKAHTHSEVNSISIVKKGVLNPVIFDNWITLMLFSTTLFRIKGVLNMTGFDRKFIFQAVGSQFVSELGPAWEAEERVNKLVFIGKRLDRKMIEAGFEKCII